MSGNMNEKTEYLMKKVDSSIDDFLKEYCGKGDYKDCYNCRFFTGAGSVFVENCPFKYLQNTMEEVKFWETGWEEKK